MNTITRQFNTAEEAAIVMVKVSALAARAAKKGIATDLTSTVAYDNDDATWGDRFTVTVTFSDLVRLAGGWELVAIADATATDEPMIFTFDDSVHIDGAVDMMRCDHCGRRTERKKVLFVKNDAGDEMQVGGSCSKDFLGHDPFWAAQLFDELDSSVGNSTQVEYPTEIVLQAAIMANRIGFRKSHEIMSTRRIMEAILKGSFFVDEFYAEERELLAKAPAASVTLQQVIDWMLEQDGEFGANLRRIAESKNIGEKAFGIAAYAPAGADNYRVRLVEEMARRAAEEAARENATPCPTGKVEVVGKVSSLRWVSNEYGDTLKMRVITDAGWAVYGTVASSIIDDIEQGDIVRFCASVTPSDNDELFGFFKRPTKAEIIEQVKVS